MAERIAVLGAGSWGMALAYLLDAAGNSICLWEFDAAEYGKLLECRGNPDRLSGFQLPETIALTNDVFCAIRDADLIVLATPSQYLRSVISPIAEHLDSVGGIVNAAKGIETGTLKRMSEVVAEETGFPYEKIATLSGPSHAEEVVLDIPTTVVVASESVSFAGDMQRLFSDESFRVYVCEDLIGVELAGSLKNIIAIAVGVADGLNMGDNTKGALITRGLAEMTRLGLAVGARADTFAGLSGLGDLFTTCSSKHSRNRMVGERIGRGEKLADVLESMVMVAEGVETTRSGRELARQYGVEMPIANEVYRVLFQGKPPQEAVADLMGRRLKAEIWR